MRDAVRVDALEKLAVDGRTYLRGLGRGDPRELLKRIGQNWQDIERKTDDLLNEAISRFLNALDMLEKATTGQLKNTIVQARKALRAVRELAGPDGRKLKEAMDWLREKFASCFVRSDAGQQPVAMMTAKPGPNITAALPPGRVGAAKALPLTSMSKRALMSYRKSLNSFSNRVLRDSLQRDPIFVKRTSEYTWEVFEKDGMFYGTHGALERFKEYISGTKHLPVGAHPLSGWQSTKRYLDEVLGEGAHESAHIAGVNEMRKLGRLPPVAVPPGKTKTDVLRGKFGAYLPCVLVPKPIHNWHLKAKSLKKHPDYYKSRSPIVIDEVQQAARTVVGRQVRPPHKEVYGPNYRGRIEPDATKVQADLADDDYLSLTKAVKKNELIAAELKNGDGSLDNVIAGHYEVYRKAFKITKEKNDKFVEETGDTIGKIAERIFRDPPPWE